MTLDAATADLISQMEQSGVRPIHELTPDEARAQSPPPRGGGPEMRSTSDRRVLVSGGAISVRVLVPSDEPKSMVTYFHGGGWVLGSLEHSDLFGRHLAAATNSVVVVVDYRLAPEYRFPTAVDDAYAAVCWVDENMEALAGARLPLVVCGDSSGGNLAAVAAIRARDRSGPGIDLQVLMYPITDCDFNTTSYQDPANELLLSRETMMWFWDQYAPSAAGRTHPHASPLQTVHMSGLPPAIVITAEHDVLRDDGEIYATRLMKAGIPVAKKRFAAQMHSFVTMVDLLPGSEAALAYLGESFERLLPHTESGKDRSGTRVPA